MKPLEFPNIPEVGETFRGVGKTRPRYEDICQDGRLRIQGAWAPIGPILWGGKIPGLLPFMLASRDDGVRSVLTRVFLDGGVGPMTAMAPVETEVRTELARNLDDEGNLRQLLLNTWLSSKAQLGKRGDPSVPGRGEPQLISRAYGQHVMTRPSAPRGQRRVEALKMKGEAYVPEAVGEYYRPEAAVEVPAGAELIDLEPRDDAVPVVFGLTHTDGNQHVNFLAYANIVESVALRRLHELGFDRLFLAEKMELGYRKPCFAGEIVSVVMQAFRYQGELGVSVAITDAPPGTGFGTAREIRCAARVLFTE
jgi:acyl-CoA thioesterase FadM